MVLPIMWGLLPITIKYAGIHIQTKSKTDYEMIHILCKTNDSRVSQK